MNGRIGSKATPPRPESAPRRRSREKTGENLLLAILRVEKKGVKLSISAVAHEAGVSASLVHNTYPEIAERIRAQIGRATRQQRDAKATETAAARVQLRALHAELNAALADVARLASINETLRQEVAALKAGASGKVSFLPPRRSVGANPKMLP